LKAVSGWRIRNRRAYRIDGPPTKIGGLDVDPPQRAVVPTPTPTPDTLSQLDAASAANSNSMTIMERETRGGTFMMEPPQN
jgi:hypothetical protein